MGANKNFLREFGLYPKINPSSLSTNSAKTAQLSALGTGLGTAAEARNDASRTTREIDDKNRLEKQFITSQAFHRTPGGRVRETTAGE
jgi:hypothetical protein